MAVKQPYSDLLPPLSTEEFAALKADLKANGQLTPVIVDESGAILDGHHRQAILGKSAKTKTIKGLSEGEKQAYVFRSNFTRRNLSGDQKKDARDRMKAVADVLRKEDHKRWTQAKLAEVFGVDQRTVGRWLPKTMPNRQTPNRNTAPPPDARVTVPATEKPVIADRVVAGQPQSQVAADYGISQGQVSRICKAEETKRERAAAPKPKPPRTYPASDLAFKVLEHVVGLSASVRDEYGTWSRMLAHKDWDKRETNHVRQLVEALNRDLTEWTKELKK